MREKSFTRLPSAMSNNRVGPNDKEALEDNLGSPTVQFQDVKQLETKSSPDHRKNSVFRDLILPPTEEPEEEVQNFHSL